MARRPTRRCSGSLGALADRTTSSQPTGIASQGGSEDFPSSAGLDATNPLSITSLTLDTPLAPLRPKKRVPATPFRFLDLPPELRVKVYENYFDDTDKVLDLGPENYKRVHKTLGLVRVCKQVHHEATHFFYSTRAVRIFPTYPGRYFKSKKPMLARLKPNQRQCITSLELRLGPGWNNPPRGWAVNDGLGLRDCLSVRKLTVFVQCDPSDGFYEGFRRSEGFYEGFSAQLLSSVLSALPLVEVIEFDAWPGVKKTGNMMCRLLSVAAKSERRVEWGPERGWTDVSEDEDMSVSEKAVKPMDEQDRAHDVVVLA